MKDVNNTIAKYRAMLKNQEHKSMVGILAEVRDLLKVIAHGSADKSGVAEAVSNAFEKGKPEFETAIKEIERTYGDQDGFITLSHPCEAGEMSLMLDETDGKYNTSKIDKPLDDWWLTMADAQAHKKQGLCLVVCKIPVDKICAIHNPLTLSETTSELVLNGPKTSLMSFSVESGSYTIKEKYTGDW